MRPVNRRFTLSRPASRDRFSKASRRLYASSTALCRRHPCPSRRGRETCRRLRAGADRPAGGARRQFLPAGPDRGRAGKRRAGPGTGDPRLRRAPGARPSSAFMPGRLRVQRPVRARLPAGTSRRRMAAPSSSTKSSGSARTTQSELLEPSCTGRTAHALRAATTSGSSLRAWTSPDRCGPGHFREDLFYRPPGPADIACAPCGRSGRPSPIGRIASSRRFAADEGKRIRGLSRGGRSACSPATTGPATCGSSRTRSTAP